MTQLELEPGRALLVRLEPGLDRSRLMGLYYAIKHCPGVELVCDLSVISDETLRALLMPDEYKIPTKGRRISGRTIRQ